MWSNFPWNTLTSPTTSGLVVAFFHFPLSLPRHSLLGREITVCSSVLSHGLRQTCGRGFGSRVHLSPIRTTGAQGRGRVDRIDFDSVPIHSPQTGPATGPESRPPPLMSDSGDTNTGRQSWSAGSGSFTSGLTGSRRTAPPRSSPFAPSFRAYDVWGTSDGTGQRCRMGDPTGRVSLPVRRTGG